MSGHSTYKPTSGFGKFMDDRLPIARLIHDSFVSFPVPRNLNSWYTFGGILMVMLVSQIITGIVIAMHYVPNEAMAFDSVHLLRRDVAFGNVLQSWHAVGASMFFVAVYVHIFRGLYYGSYKAPREVLWILGVIIYLLMMATAFMGYVLPWGQMSYWGAQVITNFFSAIPLVGDTVREFLLGGYAVGNATLNRFFSLHYLLPFMIVGLVILHVWTLHVTGQTNPTGVEVKSKQDVIPFTPYATVKDAFAMVVFMIIMCYFVFFLPDYLGHADNYIPANSNVTPAHIVPEWYFLPFYAVLRAIDFNIGIPFTEIVLIDSKLGGVLAMFSAIAVLFFVPWLDTSDVRSSNYRPMYKIFFWLFVLNAIFLGYLGSRPAEGIWIPLMKLTTFWYFFHFLIVMPLLGWFEKPLPRPASIMDAVTEKASGAAKASVVILAAGVAFGASQAEAASYPKKKPIEQEWSFAGPFGHYDKAQLQRGLKVYTEACAACHSMNLLSYRNLSALGYSDQQIKNYAAEFEVTDGPNEDGEMFERPARPTDRFVAPFANSAAAAASNGGAVPPDMSLLAKARAPERGFPTFIFDIVTMYGENGADYIYSLLTGFQDAPEGVKVGEGLHYNPYFIAGEALAMAAPLDDDSVEFDDGTPSTLEQQAKDVSAFLTWAADPNLTQRKQRGFIVMIFLFLFAGLLFFTKRKIWSDVPH